MSAAKRRHVDGSTDETGSNDGHRGEESKSGCVVVLVSVSRPAREGKSHQSSLLATLFVGRGRKPLRLRNYKPKDESLKAFEAPAQPPPSKEIEQSLRMEDDAVTATSSSDPMSLAPKKANWDLKRDMAPKMARLERATQRAIAELIRERMAETEGAQREGQGNEEAQGWSGTDLAAAVTARAEARNTEDDEDV